MKIPLKKRSVLETAVKSIEPLHTPWVSIKKTMPASVVTFHKASLGNLGDFLFMRRLLEMVGKKHPVIPTDC